MYALDREFIRDKIFNGFARVPTGPINSVVNFYDGNVRRYALDRKKSEALLDEMGLKRGPDGIRIKLDLNPVPVIQTWMRLVPYNNAGAPPIRPVVPIHSLDQAR